MTEHMRNTIEEAKVEIKTMYAQQEELKARQKKVLREIDEKNL